MIRKQLILESCYECPYNSMIWMEEEKESVEHPDDEFYLVRFGCNHFCWRESGTREKHGRLVTLTDSMTDRPGIPIWCPLQDAKES